MVESYLPYILLNEIQTMFSRKALDNIDLNRMSRRYVSGVLQNDWNDPLDFRSLDRSQLS